MEKERELITSITILNYIDRVKLSEARRVRYYEKGKKLPERCKKGLGTKYTWVKVKTKYLLYDMSTNKPVIANPRSQGTPKIKMIRGQDFYSGFGHYSERITIVNAIKDFFEKDFSKIKKIKTYPLEVEFQYHDLLKTDNTGDTKMQSDLDNKRFAYEKCSLDLLKKLNKIVDDNLLYIRKLSSEFIPVELKDRKLVINIYKY